MKDLVYSLAKEARYSIPFYSNFYKKDIEDFESIPLLTKQDLKSYNGSYWLYKGIETQSSKTSGNNIIVQNSLNDFVIAFSDFFKQPVFKDRQCIIVTTKDFLLTQFMELPKIVIPTSDAESIERLNRLFDSYYDNFLILMGRNEWIGYLAQKKLIRNNHYIVHMPKYNTYPFDFDDFRNVKQIVCFPTTECGLIGYYTSECSCKEFHIYRQDILVEEIESQLVVSFNREHFPFIRYCQEDKIEIKDIVCNCGFKGKAFEYLGRI